MVILNLHGIGKIPRTVDDGEHSCWIESLFLLEILDYVVTRDDVILTVDDGNKSDIEILLPQLLKRNLKCSFFVCSGRIGKNHFLNAKELQEIQQSGMPIGSHGKHHQAWRGLDTMSLTEEIEESRFALSDVLGTQIKTAACPFGSYNRKILKLLRDTGFEKVYTSDTGHCKQTDWLTRRNTVKRTMSIIDIRRIVESTPNFSDKIRRYVKTLIKRHR